MTDYRPEPIDAQTALSRFLTAVKNQADIDPTFRTNLILALGIPVIFEGESELFNVDPHIVAALKDELQFRAIYGRLTGPKLRTVLTTKSKLASAADVRGKSPEQMMDMLWERAVARAEERGLKK